MQVDIFFGVQIGGEDSNVTSDDAHELLGELGSSKKVSAGAMKKYLHSYGGSNNDGAVYLGFVIRTLVDDYASRCFKLYDLKPEDLSTNKELHEAIQWWQSSEDALAIKDKFGIDKSVQLNMLLITDSD